MYLLYHFIQILEITLLIADYMNMIGRNNPGVLTAPATPKLSSLSRNQSTRSSMRNPGSTVPNTPRMDHRSTDCLIRASTLTTTSSSGPEHHSTTISTSTTTTPKLQLKKRHQFDSGVAWTSSSWSGPDGDELMQNPPSPFFENAQGCDLVAVNWLPEVVETHTNSTDALIFLVWSSHRSFLVVSSSKKNDPWWWSSSSSSTHAPRCTYFFAISLSVLLICHLVVSQTSYQTKPWYGLLLSESKPICVQSIIYLVILKCVVN